MCKRLPVCLAFFLHLLTWAFPIPAMSAMESHIFLRAPDDRAMLEAAIETERPGFAPPPGITGITVPHHLLAADLVARGFWAASANDYDRIILISPDHFRRVQGPFAVAREPLETVFGPLTTDAEAVASLVNHPSLFEPAEAPGKEHGLMSVAPFIRWFFPGTPVVAVLASVHSTPQEWQAAARALADLMTDRTLVVQSTDYSHYLRLAEAILRDQESLAMIAARDPGGIAMLRQPDHMDSQAAQYLQLALQRRQWGSKPIIVANRNSAEYGGDADATTSYVVTVYSRDPVAGAVLDYPDQKRFFFAGDTLLGRYFDPILQAPAVIEMLIDHVLTLTQGAPLVLNLEGVLLKEPVVGLRDGAHLMLEATAIPQLLHLNVVAAGLANNHSLDFGPQGLAMSRSTLVRHRITSLAHGEVQDLGGLRVVPLTFLPGRYRGPGVIEGPDDLDAICSMDADPPLVALVHWGEEYTSVPGPMEQKSALALANCGVALVIGAHSHQASAGIESFAGGALQVVYSLGNFLFDQSSGRTSGALLEVRVFGQGTLATRLVSLPNLFDLGQSLRAMSDHRH